VRVRKLADDARPVFAGVHPDGVLTRPPGLFGGSRGGPVRAVLLDAHGQVVTDYGTGALVELTRTNEILEVQLGGGAGYGDPRDRPVAEVEEDLRGGYVTLTGAERDYGCVVAPDGRIDLAATPALRSQRRPGC
jgi:5-oxoprolinase (ATP-hydrolysing)/N-methylhydantoinase A